jgi:hypothetical protein
VGGRAAGERQVDVTRVRWKQWGKGWGGGGSELGFGDEEEGEGTRGNMRVMAWRKGWGREWNWELVMM